MLFKTLQSPHAFTITPLCNLLQFFKAVRILYSFVVYLYVSGSGSINSLGEERATLSAVVYLQSCGFCSERFPLPLGGCLGWATLFYCGTP